MNRQILLGLLLFLTFVCLSTLLSLIVQNIVVFILMFALFMLTRRMIDDVIFYSKHRKHPHD